VLGVIAARLYAQLLFSLSPFLFRRYSLLLAARLALSLSFFLSFSRSPSTGEWWCTGLREEEGLAGWESFCQARRHARAMRELAENSTHSTGVAGEGFLLRFFLFFALSLSICPIGSLVPSRGSDSAHRPTRARDRPVISQRRVICTSSPMLESILINRAASDNCFSTIMRARTIREKRRERR